MLAGRWGIPRIELRKRGVAIGDIVVGRRVLGARLCLRKKCSLLVKVLTFLDDVGPAGAEVKADSATPYYRRSLAEKVTKYAYTSHNSTRRTSDSKCTSHNSTRDST